MWGSVIGGILGVLSVWAFASHTADKVEDKLKDRLDAIEDKLDTIEHSLKPQWKNPFDGVI